MLDLRNALYCLLFLTVLSPVGALAQSTWDGGGDGSSWSDALNWDPDGVPTNTTDVLLDGGPTIQLDVAASTLDLTLVDTILEGPGDLTVAGQLDWGLATVSGTGILTAVGGLTFLEGSDKIIGRPVEIACDAIWEDSHIFFDIGNGGAVHQQSGFALSIVDHEEGDGPSRTGAASRRATVEFHAPEARIIQASHRGAPLIGEDPTADDTDVYVFTFDGDISSNTAVMYDVSTSIGGLYVQTSGPAIYGSGSGFDVDAIYQLGTGAEVIFDEGTHVVQGQIEPVAGAMPLGVSTTGDQTDFILDPEGFRDVPFSTRGSHTLGENVEIETSVAVDAQTTFAGSGSSTASIRDLEVRPSSIEALFLQGFALNLETILWLNGQIQLTQGTTLTAVDMTIDHTNSNLAMTNDADPAQTESISLTGRFYVEKSGSVPPRIDVDAGFPNGSRVEVETNAEIVFLSQTTLGGRVELGAGSTVDLRQGSHTINPTAELVGPGTLKVSADATVALNQPQTVEVVMDLRGTLLPSGSNEFPFLTLNVEGGKIRGPNGPGDELAARVRFVPSSSVTRAKIENAVLYLVEGSEWRSGHIDWGDEAVTWVRAGAKFIVSHTATNLQLTEDSDPETVEMMIIEGDVVVDNTASVPPSWNVPTQVLPTGKFIVEPGQNVNIPNVMTVQGDLRLREGAGARFIFKDSEIAPGGKLSGNGTVTQQLNGDLFINGTVDPGDGPGKIGVLSFVGPMTLGASSVVHFDLIKEGGNPIQHDQVQVNGTANFDGTADVQVESDSVFDETGTIVEAIGTNGAWSNVNVTGASTIDLNYTGAGVDAHVTLDETLTHVVGYVVNDIDLDGLDDEDPLLVGIEAHLVAGAGKGAVVATDLTDEAGHFDFFGDFDGTYEVQLVLDPVAWAPSDPASGARLLIIGANEVSVSAGGFAVRTPSEQINVSTTDEGGPGSLRVAIEMANASPSPSVEIDLTGVEGRIFLATPLPVLEQRTRIIGTPGAGPITDGRSQSRGSSAPPLILDGTNCAGCDGLVLAGGESLLRGLGIENFEGYGLVIEESDLTFVSDTRLTANAAGGILIASGSRNFIGAGSNGFPNEIKANGGPGISVLAGSSHNLQGNRIYENGGLAIDLGADGATANDERDGDSGPNGLQNAPVLTGADPLGFNVQGTLASRPLSPYVIEVYGNQTCPEGERGDLQVLLGSGVVVTDEDGLVDFVIETTPYAGQLTAIATSGEGSTSEVSACLMSVVTDVPTASGDHVEFAHRVFPNPSRGRTTLALQLGSSGSVEASLHDVTGRRLVTIFEGDLDAGRHEIEWDGTDGRGRLLHNGVYFYTIKIGGRRAHGRITTVR